MRLELTGCRHGRSIWSFQPVLQHLYANSVRLTCCCQVNKKIFVRGLPWETNDQSLRAVFEQYGEIAEVGFAAPGATYMTGHFLSAEPSAFLA